MPYVPAWVWSALSALGLYQKKAKLVLLGLDNAGKTTLLQMLREGRVAATSPTLHGTSEELQVGDVTFTAHDLGGHAQARRVWQTYTPAVDAVVFVVDATARDRFDEARRELAGLMDNDQVQSVPILVLGNKIDAPGAVGEDTLRDALGLGMWMTQDRPLAVCMCSVLKQQGYGAGFRWLSRQL